jgi:hypothetical protein
MKAVLLLALCPFLAGCAAPEAELRERPLSPSMELWIWWHMPEVYSLLKPWPAPPSDL